MTRFNEWKKEFDALQGKSKDIQLCEIVETLSVEGKFVTITLGKDAKIEIDDGQVDARYLRELYTNNKEEFSGVLEVLTERVNSALDANNILMTAVADKAIPGAVVQRLRGDKVDTDNVALVKNMTETKLHELGKLLKGLKFKETMEKFTFIFPRIAEREMGLTRASYVTVNFGVLSANDDDDYMLSSNLEDQLFFLANYNVIVSRLEQFSRTLSQLKNIK